MRRVRTVWLDDDGAWRTTLRGRQVLADPRINKGVAFSDAERASLDLIGLIPAGHLTLDQQASRIYAQFLRQSSDLARNVLDHCGRHLVLVGWEPCFMAENVSSTANPSRVTPTCC